MRSPIAESDRGGATIKIIALSREPGNPRLTLRPVRIKQLVWEI